VTYPDSSALFKLVVEESGTAGLRQFLRDRAGEPRIASALVRTEVVRTSAHGRHSRPGHARGHGASRGVRG